MSDAIWYNGLTSFPGHSGPIPPHTGKDNLLYLGVFMFAMLLLFLNLSHAASVHEINCVKESFSFEDGIVQSDHNETRSYNLSMGRDYIRLDSRVFMYSGLNKEGMKEYTYGKDILMYESGYLYIMRKLRTENVSYARCQLIEGRKQSI